MKKESYEKLEMEVIAFDKIHMDTSSHEEREQYHERRKYL